MKWAKNNYNENMLGAPNDGFLLQWNPSFGTPLFQEHLHSEDTTWNLVPENVHIIFVSITSVEGTPLFRGKGHFFWVPRPRLNLH